VTPRILLIEDNENNRYLATYLLQAAGCGVEHAADGRRGIALARSWRPDVILLDIQLPEMDGYAVARALKADAATAAIPVVAVTSHAMVGDRETAQAAGCSGYIEKPIDPDRFAAAVLAHLRSGPAVPPS
jgi:two-component system, cell cycle response regulator DivK